MRICWLAVFFPAFVHKKCPWGLCVAFLPAVYQSTPLVGLCGFAHLLVYKMIKKTGPVKHCCKALLVVKNSTGMKIKETTWAKLMWAIQVYCVLSWNESVSFTHLFPECASLFVCMCLLSLSFSSWKLGFCWIACIFDFSFVFLWKLYGVSRNVESVLTS